MPTPATAAARVPSPPSRPARRQRASLRVCCALALAGAVAPVSAQTVSLGTAASFGVLGGSAVTNTGPSVVAADLGIFPNGASSVTGFPPGVVTGTTHFADAVAQNAQNAVTTAYDTLAGRACNTTIPADLGGLTLPPGVYCSASTMGLTGTLTLDAQGNPDAVFIFQVGSALTTASASRVRIINGGSSCNLFWQIGSSAVLGTGTEFAGNILALQSITLTTGASTSGRLLARNGAVTLDSNAVNACGAVAGVGGTPNLASVRTVPALAPWSLLLLAGLLLPLAAWTIRRG